MRYFAIRLAIIFYRYIHRGCHVLPEWCALFQFVENIGPHFLSGAILYLKVPGLNFVLDKEIPSLDVLSSLGTGHTAINLKLHH